MNSMGEGLEEVDYDFIDQTWGEVLYDDVMQLDLIRIW
jgi:hypothetical protein